jgi:bifunctional ADP-heptose synthase (sugar kinase/adenylyltransferase)
LFGADVVKRHGGKVTRITFVKGRSTANIIKRILGLHGK